MQKRHGLLKQKWGQVWEPSVLRTFKTVITQQTVGREKDWCLKCWGKNPLGHSGAWHHCRISAQALMWAYRWKMNPFASPTPCTCHHSRGSTQGKSGPVPRCPWSWQETHGPRGHPGGPPAALSAVARGQAALRVAAGGPRWAPRQPTRAAPWVWPPEPRLGAAIAEAAGRHLELPPTDGGECTRHVVPQAEAFVGPWVVLPREQSLDPGAGVCHHSRPPRPAQSGEAGAVPAVSLAGDDFISGVWHGGTAEWSVLAVRGAATACKERLLGPAPARRFAFPGPSIPRQPARRINYKPAFNVSDSLNGIFHSNFVIKIERPFGCDHTSIINCICLRYWMNLAHMLHCKATWMKHLPNQAHHIKQKNNLYSW